MPRKGRIHWLAVLTGHVLDVGLSLLIGGLVAGRVADGFFSSAAGVTLALVLTLSTMAGGWLAARIAREERLLHGVLVAAIPLVLTLLSAWDGTAVRGEEIVRVCLSVPLAGLAGYASRWTPVRS